MGKPSLVLIMLVLALVMHSKARNIPSARVTKIEKSDTEQTLVHANEPAESPRSTSLKDKKNFVYGGVGGFAGMGGYAGVVGGMPLLGGLGGMSKYGGLGGLGGLGGYNGLGGLGGGAGGGGLGGEPGGGAKGGVGGLVPFP